MPNQEFRKIDKRFVNLQAFLENISDEQSMGHMLMQAIIGEKNNSLLKNAHTELQDIRDFYHDCFYTASKSDQIDILKRYNEFSVIMSQLIHNQITLKEASDRINKTTSDWESDITCDNVLNVCEAIAWAIPLAAGIILLPFIVPVLSVTSMLGFAVLIASLSSIVLSLNQICDNLFDLQDSDPIFENSRRELSFFGKLNDLNKIMPSSVNLANNKVNHAEEPDSSNEDYAPTFS